MKAIFKQLLNALFCILSATVICNAFYWFYIITSVPLSVYLANQ